MASDKPTAHAKTAVMDNTAATRAVAKWLTHIQALAEGIGPRGSATEAEREGSRYCAKMLEDLGYKAETETFSSSGSVFKPHLVASLGLVAAFALYPLAPPLTAAGAAALAVLVVIAEVLELALKDNPLRWVLPKRPSQNVHAVAAPAGDAQRDLILIGHVDTQRTPIIFSSPRWMEIYKVLSTAAFAAFIAQALIYAWGAWTRAGWVWPVSIATVFFALLLLALTVHAERTPYTPGANDNATAAGLVLTLAEALNETPLANTRVWLVCTGSEEALHEGARHFFARHKHEFKAPRAVNFEMLGCAGPAWLVREGIVTSLYPSPGLRELAETVARENPALEAYPAMIHGGVTEASDAINAGVPAITLMGVDADGRAPFWHQMEDTRDKMRPEILAKTYTFVWAMLRKIDA